MITGRFLTKNAVFPLILTLTRLLPLTWPCGPSAFSRIPLAASKAAKVSSRENEQPLQAILKS